MLVAPLSNALFRAFLKFKTAATITQKGPCALRLVKEMILAGQDADHRTANLLEQHSFGLVFGTEDAAEGISAFLDKRNPTFQGR